MRVCVMDGLRFGTLRGTLGYPVPAHTPAGRQPGSCNRESRIAAPLPRWPALLQTMPTRCCSCCGATSGAPRQRQRWAPLVSCRCVAPHDACCLAWGGVLPGGWLISGRLLPVTLPCSVTHLSAGGWRLAAAGKQSIEGLQKLLEQGQEFDIDAKIGTAHGTAGITWCFPDCSCSGVPASTCRMVAPPLHGTPLPSRLFLDSFGAPVWLPPLQM